MDGKFRPAVMVVTGEACPLLFCARRPYGTAIRAWIERPGGQPSRTGNLRIASAVLRRRDILQSSNRAESLLLDRGESPEYTVGSAAMYDAGMGDSNLLLPMPTPSFQFRPKYYFFGQDLRLDRLTPHQMPPLLGSSRCHLLVEGAASLGCSSAHQPAPVRFPLSPPQQCAPSSTPPGSPAHPPHAS
jgi:hypothetical protein